MEGRVLPAKQESWVLSEVHVDKKKGELTRAIGARGRRFWLVYRVSRALIIFLPVPCPLKCLPSRQSGNKISFIKQ